MGPPINQMPDSKRGPLNSGAFLTVTVVAVLLVVIMIILGRAAVQGPLPQIRLPHRLSKNHLLLPLLLLQPRFLHRRLLPFLPLPCP